MPICFPRRPCAGPDSRSHARSRLLARIAFPLVVALVAAMAQPAVAAAAYAPDKSHPASHNRNKTEPSGQFLKDWLLCGPFPLLNGTDQNTDVIRLPGLYTDFLHAFGGEAAVHPVDGQEVVYSGGTCRWKRHTSPADAIDLDAAVTKTDRVVAYAYRDIPSTKPQACILSIGSNDGIRVWLNGEEILDLPGPRGLQKDHNMVPVALRQGSNSLLLKIEDRGNRWGFACRLMPLTPDFPAEKLRLFDVVLRDDGSPVIRSRQSQSLTSAMLKSARFEVTSVAAPGRILFATDWSAAAEIPIQMDTRHFAEYRLRIQSVLREGSRQDSVLAFTAGRRTEHALFESGRSAYSIVLAAGASDSEQWAARELQQWVQAVGGVRIEIRSEETAPPGDQVILVGWGKRAEAVLAPDGVRPRDDDESFTYRSVGPSVVVWGGRQRGTLYGVMSFLERELGVRFYTPKVTVTPRKEAFRFTFLNHSESPGVRVRNDFYFEAFDPVWAARNRINGAMSHRDQPGGLECYWSVHTFYPLMPPEEFFKDHPEYYSLLDGKRTADHAQLCLSNPDVLRIITERIAKRMRESPEYLIYDVSQNDWSNPCQCRECQAVVDREGSQSGPIIQFVNQVADRVKAEFPGKFIGTLAYSYTRKPPRTLKPRDNVVVRFCSIECCFAHDFVSCPENRDFVKDMNGWAAISPHIYIWDYVVNFSHYVMPYPNFRVLKPNIQFFRDHKAIGIMEQAAYQCRGGEFAELRSYLISRLLWDPEAEVEPILDDFFHGYYGRAGQHVRAYFDLLHGRLTAATHIHLGLQHDDKLFSDDFVRQAGVLFDQAEAVADNEEIRQRVELARLPLLYLKCKRSPLIARQDGSYARFVDIARREGVTHYAEAGESHRNAFHSEVEAAR